MKQIELKMENSQTEIEKNRMVLERFANAMCAMEPEEIALLLSEKGDYNGMNKQEFLKWLTEKFCECINDKIYQLNAKLRFCKSCKLGNATLVFNHGLFPKEIDGYKGAKGFMLDIQNGQIVDIGICYTWMNEKELYYCVTNN